MDAKAVNLEFQIHTCDWAVVVHLMGRRPLLPGMDVEVAPGVRLSYAGREYRGQERTETISSFFLGIAGDVSAERAATLLWDILSAVARTTPFGVVDLITREKTLVVHPEDPDGVQIAAAAVQALRRDPIPRSFWLGE